jgi:uncharacterized membrane protein
MANPLRKLTDEPLHAPTTHFPMALYPAVVLFDILALTRQDGSVYTHAAFVIMIAAAVMTGIAMTTGFVHLGRDVDPKSGAWRVAILHMSVQLAAAAILFVSLLLRIGNVNDPQPPTTAIVLGIAGTVVMLAGGWLGGRLVYTHGIGTKSSASRSNDVTSSDH